LKFFQQTPAVDRQNFNRISTAVEINRFNRTSTEAWNVWRRCEGLAGKATAVRACNSRLQEGGLYVELFITDHTHTESIWKRSEEHLPCKFKHTISDFCMWLPSISCVLGSQFIEHDLHVIVSIGCERDRKDTKSYAGSQQNTPCINSEKGDTLAQSAVGLPHHRHQLHKVCVWYDRSVMCL